MAILTCFPLLSHASTVLVLGDSISAGYGLEQTSQGWVALMQDALNNRGVRVVNASISGDTTAGGLARLPALLQRVEPSTVVIELGGNDGLRGLTPAQMDANLTAMIAAVRSRGANVLLLGMKMPPNYGKRYADLFRGVYASVAAKTGVRLVPFLLEGVGGVDEFMQADGIHPNAKAQPLLMKTVLKALDDVSSGKPDPSKKAR